MHVNPVPEAVAGSEFLENTAIGTFTGTCCCLDRSAHLPRPAKTGQSLDNILDHSTIFFNTLFPVFVHIGGTVALQRLRATGVFGTEFDIW